MWNRISEKQRKEIVISKGGSGYYHFKMITGIYSFMILFVVIVAMSEELKKSAQESQMFGLFLVAGIISVSLMWLMLVLMSFGISVFIRWFRIYKKEVVYQYCVIEKRDVGSWFANNCIARLEDGTMLSGYLQFSDLNKFSESKQLIAYKLEDGKKVYFSYVRKKEV